MTIATKTIRKAIEDNGIDLRVLALRMGLVKHHPNPNWPDSPDIGAVKRYLGMTECINGDGYRGYRKSLREPTVLRILDAAGIDPWEVGL